MVKLLHTLILFFLLSSDLSCFSQKTLQILFTRFGISKRFEVHVGDVFEYKLKGQFTYHKSKIVNLQDSSIVLANDNVIKLNELKVICLRRSNYVVRLFQAFFIDGGCIFFFLNTTNNLINDKSPALDSKAALIGAGLVTTGLLIKQIGIRRLRINDRKHLKIIDLTFDNLSEKPEK